MSIRLPMDCQGFTEPFHSLFVQLVPGLSRCQLLGPLKVPEASLHNSSPGESLNHSQSHVLFHEILWPPLLQLP
ncbi:hypothetical protein Y1Q_0002148 [Alligator mississippiensis]|uniref:Uncharacterized protein n=1 Tax=Alligator mississippiensis TaxID=8496 RepID=A0A151MPR0_ALLMI|nr:hypothetical protein Y1Q_0002148 [Alligator mississippiensis]